MFCVYKFEFIHQFLSSDLDDTDHQILFLSVRAAVLLLSTDIQTAALAARRACYLPFSLNPSALNKHSCKLKLSSRWTENICASKKNP